MNKEHDLIILQSDVKSIGIFKGERTNKLVHSVVPESMREAYNMQHLYVVSNEDINEGDWCIWKNQCFKVDTNNAYSNTNNITLGYCKQFPKNIQKIIASTDPNVFDYAGDFDYYKQSIFKISLPFIYFYIDEYNAGRKIEKVEVEYEEYWVKLDGSKVTNNDNVSADYIKGSETKIKINPDNTINIKPLKQDVNTLANKYCSKTLENGLTINGVKQEYTLDQLSQIYSLMYFAFEAGSSIKPFKENL